MSALSVHPHSILNYPEHYNEVLTVKNSLQQLLKLTVNMHAQAMQVNHMHIMKQCS